MFFEAGVALKYHIRRWVGFEIAYSFLELDSNFDEFGYTDNRVKVGVRAVLVLDRTGTRPRVAGKGYTTRLRLRPMFGLALLVMALVPGAVLRPRATTGGAGPGVPGRPQGRPEGHRLAPR